MKDLCRYKQAFDAEMYDQLTKMAEIVNAV